MKKKRILIIPGSTRKASINKLLATAAHKAAVDLGIDATLIDLADYPAAIYNGDDETADGIPESMVKLKKLMSEHQGFIVVSPEYNGHVPPLLVNTFSWLSRRAEGDDGMIAFKNKKAAIMAASPGRLGGVRVLPRLRDMLAEVGVMVTPGFVTLAQAMQAFDENGGFTDHSNTEAVDQ